MKISRFFAATENIQTTERRICCLLTLWCKIVLIYIQKNEEKSKKRRYLQKQKSSLYLQILHLLLFSKKLTLKSKKKKHEMLPKIEISIRCAKLVKIN